jgi:hypothetical protein
VEKWSPECCNDQHDKNPRIPCEHLSPVKDADRQHIERGDHRIDLQPNHADYVYNVTIECCAVTGED